MIFLSERHQGGLRAGIALLEKPKNFFSFTEILFLSENSLECCVV